MQIGILDGLEHGRADVLGHGIEAADRRRNPVGELVAAGRGQQHSPVMLVKDHGQCVGQRQADDQQQDRLPGEGARQKAAHPGRGPAHGAAASGTNM
jgi:hypothetical protein